MSGVWRIPGAAQGPCELKVSEAVGFGEPLWKLTLRVFASCW